VTIDYLKVLSKYFVTLNTITGHFCHLVTAGSSQSAVTLWLRIPYTYSYSRPTSKA